MTHVIDGKAIAAAMHEQTARSAALLRERGVIPALAAVVPTGDESAAWYVRSIERAAARAGIECRIHRLDPPAGRSRIADKLAERRMREEAAMFMSANATPRAWRACSASRPPSSASWDSP